MAIVRARAAAANGTATTQRRRQDPQQGLGLFRPGVGTGQGDADPDGVPGERGEDRQGRHPGPRAQPAARSAEGAGGQQRQPMPRVHAISPTAWGQNPRAPATSTAPSPQGADVRAVGSSDEAPRNARVAIARGCSQNARLPAATVSNATTTTGTFSRSASGAA